ncbi:hypothetical protein ACJ41O_006941 [Fusarium nematophilum]
MDSSEFRKAAMDAVNDITSYMDSLESRPVVSQVKPGYLRLLLPDSAPESPEPWEAIHADVETKILPAGETVETCKARGLYPFYLTATLGTTDTCAIDHFSGIAPFLDSDPSDEIWVHVDAAYAGSALVLPEYQHLTATVASFHSFNFNPHKWLLANFDCSALWVRDRSWLIEVLSIQPPYLRNQFSQAGSVTGNRNWQIPLGRRFRSIKLWFVLRSYGASGIRENLLEDVNRGGGDLPDADSSTREVCDSCLHGEFPDYGEEASEKGV